jgi:hypothetical protein
MDGDLADVAEGIESISRWYRFAKAIASQIDTTGKRAARTPILEGSHQDSV